MLTLDINAGNKMYAVYIKKGMICELGRMLKKISHAEKVAVITDINVNNFYGTKVLNILNSVGFDAHVIVVEAGERSKTMTTLAQVYTELLKFNITRSDCILTLGGGVVGDLGGFAATTFLRGIPYVQVPTSLLSQIDSSIGGKVAVDLPEGKNLIGSFYHPKAVYIDPNFLDTLDLRFLNDGMAEVIKYGCINDDDFFEQLMGFQNKEDLFSNIEQIILTCLNIKKVVVEQDELDTGSRMILNFGHTLGHAIENHFNYIRYTHGEAVAIGMYQITRNSEQMGITQPGTQKRIKEILLKYSLPYEMPQDDAMQIIKAIAFDKKIRGKNIDIVLLNSIGKCFIKRINREHIPKFFI